jgi:hypothetical protein
VKQRGIKCLQKEAIRAASLKKKMNNHLSNDAVFANYALVLRFVFISNYTPDWLQTFNFVQFYPLTNFISSPIFERLFPFSTWFRIYAI